MDIWGRCGVCARWFYCSSMDVDAAGGWRCPVCGSEPVAVENRGARREAGARGVTPLV
jgi:hypothetical protein